MWHYRKTLAKALSSTKAGAIEVTFNDETYLDLMSEQAVWPLIMNVMVTAFDALRAACEQLPISVVETEVRKNLSGQHHR